MKEFVVLGDLDFFESFWECCWDLVVLVVGSSFSVFLLLELGFLIHVGLDLLDYHDNFLKGIGIGIVLVVYLAYFFLFLFHLGQQGFGGDGLLGFDVGESGDILVLGGNEDVGVLGVGNHHGGDGDALGEGIHFALGELDEIVGKDLLLVDEDGDGLVVGSNYLAVVEDSPLGWGGLLDGIGVGDLDGGRCVGCYFFWAWQEPENQCLHIEIKLGEIEQTFWLVLLLFLSSTSSTASTSSFGKIAGSNTYFGGNKILLKKGKLRVSRGLHTSSEELLSA
jgi:hypothetical protein